MRILYVEDSKKLQSSVSTALRKNGYSVDVTGDGKEGLWFAQSNPYDVIILDIMLPSMDGISILKCLREEENEAQVLMLTAKDAIDDRVEGLENGADDYLIKPFSLKELMARVGALCRRKYDRKTVTIHIEDLIINTRSKIVTRAGQPLDLSQREFAILEYLALRRGDVVSRQEIESHVYDDLTTLMSNAIDSKIYLLRKKLIVSDNSTPMIQTRRGLGYIIE